MSKQNELDKPASKEFVMNALAYCLDWATKYMEAARMGDEDSMKRLNDNWNPESLLAEDEPTNPTDTDGELTKVLDEILPAIWNAEHKYGRLIRNIDGTPKQITDAKEYILSRVHSHQQSLLAEVEERVIGEDVPNDGGEVIHSVTGEVKGHIAGSYWESCRRELREEQREAIQTIRKERGL